MNVLRAGYAQVDITPPVGVELTGFGLRKQPSIGIHDRLYARAVVLDDGRIRVGIVSCDLLGFSGEFDNRLRRVIARKGVAPADHLMIACTHTHSGPGCMPLRGCGEMNPRWMRRLFRQVVGVAVQAGRSLHPVTVHYAHGGASASAVRWLAAFDRPFNDTGRRRTRPRLTDVSVIQFRRGPRPWVNIAHYPCHPVVLGSNNRKVSADFPGVVAAFLRRKTGAPTLFLNGACGNLNPRGIAHCRIPSGFGRLRAIGESLGRTALAALRKSRPIRDPRLRVALQRVRVPLRIPTVRELQRAFRGYQSEFQKGRRDPLRQAIMRLLAGWACEAMAALKSGKFPRDTTVSLQRLDVGTLRLVALGGEPFDELGARIQREVGAPCLVVGYANGNAGYLPSREAYARGSYEVDDAHKFYGLFGLSPCLESILVRAVKRIRLKSY